MAQFRRPDAVTRFGYRAGLCLFALVSLYAVYAVGAFVALGSASPFSHRMVTLFGMAVFPLPLLATPATYVAALGSFDLCCEMGPGVRRVHWQQLGVIALCTYAVMVVAPLGYDYAVTAVIGPDDAVLLEGMAANNNARFMVPLAVAPLRDHRRHRRCRNRPDHQRPHNRQPLRGPLDRGRGTGRILPGHHGHHGRTDRDARRALATLACACPSGGPVRTRVHPGAAGLRARHPVPGRTARCPPARSPGPCRDRRARHRIGGRLSPRQSRSTSRGCERSSPASPLRPVRRRDPSRRDPGGRPRIGAGARWPAASRALGPTCPWASCGWEARGYRRRRSCQRSRRD